MASAFNIPEQLLGLIRELSGFRLGTEQIVTASEAVCKRMELCHLSDTADYLQLLSKDTLEQQALVELLTINETYFLRESAYLHLLVDVLLSDQRNSLRNTPIRIFCAGCSTGEEAYSLAILLQNRYGRAAAGLFSITAVDIDSVALTKACAGVYGKSSFRGDGLEKFLHYFERLEDGRYRLLPLIRQMVCFKQCNLMEPLLETGAGQADVILYRNVSIYFSKENQIRIFSNLADLLNDGGILLVGATETLHHNLGILKLSEHNQLFYYSKPATRGLTDRRTASRTSTWQNESQQALPQQSVERQSAISDSSLCSQDPKILFDRALLLAKNRQLEQALELLEKSLSRSPSFVNALLLKACLLLDGCCYEQAASACQSVNAIDPLRCESYLISGLIARQNSKEMKALEYFRRAIFLKQDCWVAHFYSAEILYNRKEYRLANAGYRKTVSLLKEGNLQNSGNFFPLSFDAGQFITISQHKLSLLKDVR